LNTRSPVGASFAAHKLTLAAFQLSLLQRGLGRSRAWINKATT
jgi:hypothetical protein